MKAAPKRERAARPRLYFAGVVVPGRPDATVEDVQRLVVERVARHVMRRLQTTPAPAEAAD